MSLWSWLSELMDNDIVENPKPQPKIGLWEVYGDRAGSYRFRLKDGEETLVPSGHPYKTSDEAVADIKRVIEMAANSPIITE